MATGGVLQENPTEGNFAEDDACSETYSESNCGDLSGFLDWDPAGKEDPAAGIRGDSDCITKKNVEEILNGAVMRLEDIINVNRPVAQMLLRANDWDVNDISVKFYSDKIKLFKAARVPMPPDASAEPECPLCESCDGFMIGVKCGHKYCTSCWSRYIKKHFKNFGPLICVCMHDDCNHLLPPNFMLTALSDEDMKEIYRSIKAWDQCLKCKNKHEVKGEDDLTSGAKCGHRYCFSCWRRYLQEKIEAGETDISCLSTDCPALLPEDFVLNTLQEPVLTEMHQENMFRANISLHPKLHFCPNEQCKAIIYSLDPRYSGIYCDLCDKAFCVQCKAERHFPCECDTMQEWHKICESLDLRQHCLKLLECPKGLQSTENESEDPECVNCHRWVCFTCQHSCTMTDDSYFAQCTSCSLKINIPASAKEFKTSFYFSKFVDHNDGVEKYRGVKTLTSRTADHISAIKNCHLLLKYSFVFEHFLEDASLEKDNLVIRRHELEKRLARVATCAETGDSPVKMRDLFSLEMGMKDLNEFFSTCQSSHRSQLPTLEKSLEALDIDENDFMRDELAGMRGE